MLTAFILVKSSREGLTSLGPHLADIEGIAEVYTLTGEWDFIAIARVREHDELAQVVTQRLTQLDGIEKTQTMVAFQQFSAHDLEAMFGLGLEDKQTLAITPQCERRHSWPEIAISECECRHSASHSWPRRRLIGTSTRARHCWRSAMPVGTA